MRHSKIYYLEKRTLKATNFYSALNARIASAVLATAIPSVRPSVRRAVASHLLVGVLTTLLGVLDD